MLASSWSEGDCIDVPGKDAKHSEQFDENWLWVDKGNKDSDCFGVGIAMKSGRAPEESGMVDAAAAGSILHLTFGERVNSLAWAKGVHELLSCLRLLKNAKPLRDVIQGRRQCRSLVEC